jgi:hypothetical protein
MNYCYNLISRFYGKEASINNSAPLIVANKGHWAMQSAPAHLQIHTHNYENWINTTVQGATGEGM